MVKCQTSTWIVIKEAISRHQNLLTRNRPLAGRFAKSSQCLRWFSFRIDLRADWGAEPPYWAWLSVLSYFSEQPTNDFQLGIPLLSTSSSRLLWWTDEPSVLFHLRTISWPSRDLRTCFKKISAQIAKEFPGTIYEYYAGTNPEKSTNSYQILLNRLFKDRGVQGPGGCL